MRKIIVLCLICILFISVTITYINYIYQSIYDKSENKAWDSNFYSILDDEQKNNQFNYSNYGYNPSNNLYTKVIVGTGNTYYVSTSGNDNNPGTLSNPFRTIQKAIDIVNPGDTVLVRGGKYNEQPTLTRCGTTDNWITIKNYPNEIPIIDGSGIDRPWGTGLVQIGEPAWSDWSPLPARGFWGVEYVVFDGFKIINSEGYGILISMSRYVYVHNCQIFYSYGPGIEANNGHEFPPYGHWDPLPHPHHIYIINNYVGTGCNSGGGGEGISVVRCDYSEVKYCSVIDNHKEGIDFKNGCTYGTIAYNEVASPIIGIYVDTQGDYQHDFHIYSNYIHGKGGIAGGNELGGTLKNIYIYNNILCNDMNGFGCIGTEGERINIQVINNNFNVGNIALQLAVPKEAMYTDLIVKNNIIKGGCQGVNLDEGVMTEDDFILDHNLFYGTNYVYGTNYITGDPQWVDPSTGDYHLKSSSPAINTGSNTDAPSLDFDGNTRPEGTFIDIGAYEYIYNSNNNPPDKPIINGESNGKIDTEYQYTLLSTDPDGDKLSYYIEWDDNTNTGWTRLLPIGEYYNTSHTWSKKGSYTIQAKAKDKYGAESEWATLTVTMPKTQIYDQKIQFLLKIIERFPDLEKILKIII